MDSFIKKIVNEFIVKQIQDVSKIILSPKNIISPLKIT